MKTLKKMTATSLAVGVHAVAFGLAVTAVACAEGDSDKSEELLGATSQGLAEEGTGELILNEFNAVGPDKVLEDGFDPAFSHVENGVIVGDVGNGGNWIELVVTADIPDLTGYKVLWANDDPSSGHIEFTSHPVNQTLKAGTIITVRDGDTSDVSYDPCGTTPDWVINLGADDTTFISQAGAAHPFKTDNDGWRAKIVKAGTSIPVQDWVGENGSPTGVDDDSIIWAGSGINSQEVGKLEADPSAAAAIDGDPGPNYQDGNCSSFGAPNCWNDGMSTQDFSGLRTCP